MDRTSKIDNLSVIVTEILRLKFVYQPNTLHCKFSDMTSKHSHAYYI